MATQYHALAPGKPGLTRQVSILTVMPAGGDCLCIVQDDQNFRQVLRLRLTQPGREVHRIDLPPDSTKLRVVFESPEKSSTPLPTEIRFYEIPD